MYKKLIYIILTLFFCIEYSFAKDNPNLRFLDLNYLINNSIAGKKIIDKLKSKNQNLVEKHKKIEKKLKDKSDELNTQQNILEKNQFEKNLFDHRQNIKDFQKLVNDDFSNLNNEKMQMTNKLLKNIDQVMLSYVKTNKIDMIVKKESLIISNSDFDITSFILTTLDKDYKSIEWNIMKTTLSKTEIINLLPHREPMLLIDELKNIVKLKSATAILNVKKDSFFVQGHFPGQPVMPGVLIVEAFGQAAAALTAAGIDKKEYDNKLVFLMGVDKARFRNPVIPDCKLELNIEAIRSHGRVWKYKGEAFVEGKKMADAQWSATIVDRK